MSFTAREHARLSSTARHGRDSVDHKVHVLRASHDGPDCILDELEVPAPTARSHLVVQQTSRCRVQTRRSISMAQRFGLRSREHCEPSRCSSFRCLRVHLAQSPGIWIASAQPDYNLRLSHHRTALLSEFSARHARARRPLGKHRLAAYGFCIRSNQCGCARCVKAKVANPRGTFIGNTMRYTKLQRYLASPRPLPRAPQRTPSRHFASIRRSTRRCAPLRLIALASDDHHSGVQKIQQPGGSYRAAISAFRLALTTTFTTATSLCADISMKHKIKAWSCALAMLGALSNSVHADDALTGDTRLACEAILCLATGQRPTACAPSIQRYFSIHARKLGDTLRARVNFLKLCPSADSEDGIRALVDAIANGAGRCDAAALNAAQVRPNAPTGDGETKLVIDNTLPSQCRAYANNTYVDPDIGTTARYVGTPERGGFWADPQVFDQAQSEYDARIAREDAQAATTQLRSFP
jgi:hypothetical protein